MHPQIPAILITPICPHTLSFRPMLLPDSMELRICVPYNSRSTAWASFDGRGRVELKRKCPSCFCGILSCNAEGDHIKVSASKYPFPTVCADKASTDWFSSVSRTLRWNEREKQKSFVVVEEARQSVSETNKRRSSERSQYVNGADGSHSQEAPKKQDERDDDEDDEEGFDIDEYVFRDKLNAVLRERLANLGEP